MKLHTLRHRADSERRIELILAGIILLQVLLCICYGFLKKGFFVDELWGAGLANSYYRPRLFKPDVYNTNTYLSGSFFRDYLTVNPDQGFSIGSVWYNQSQDSHPPLYYLLYHILSCLRMGTFSKWTGIIINLCFFAGSGICIYLVTRRITDSAAAGLFAVALWGFSAEAVSYVILSRMYMLCAFFVILLVLKVLPFYAPEEQLHLKNYAIVLLVTTGGCLTHYYFYIAAFVLSVITCLSLLLRKRFRTMFAFGFSSLGGVLTAWAIYPQIFESLQYGDGRGEQAYENLLSSEDFRERVTALIEQLRLRLLYRPILLLTALLCALILVTLILCVVRRKQLPGKLKAQVSMLLTLELLLLIYLLFIAKLQPFYTNRYYFPITTVLWIVVFGNAILFLRVLPPMCALPPAVRRHMIPVITLLLFLLCSTGVVKSHINHRVMYLYPRQEAILEEIAQLDEPSAVYIESGSRYSLTAHCLELSCCSEILCIDISSEADLAGYTIHDTSEQAVVYIAKKLDQEAVLNQLLNQTSYQNYTLIGRGSGVSRNDIEENYIYIFSR